MNTQSDYSDPWDELLVMTEKRYNSERAEAVREALTEFAGVLESRFKNYAIPMQEQGAIGEAAAYYNAVAETQNLLAKTLASLQGEGEV